MKTLPAILLATLFLFPAYSRAAGDAAGCKDSPLLTRIPGSVITDCVDKPDDQFNFQISGKDNWVEGEYHHSDYDFSKVASKAEVIRNLQTALKAPGFTVSRNGDGGYFLARAGKSWIAIDVGGSYYAQTIVVEIKLEQLMAAHADGKYAGFPKSAATPVPDAKGCTDSPLITRFPGSVLNGCSDSPDDKFNYQIAGKDNWVEGELHQSHYDFSQVASKAEVIRNIQTALKAAGFVVSRNGDGGYFLAQAGKSWLAIDVSGGSYAQAIVVEKKVEQLMTAHADGKYAGFPKSTATPAPDAKGCTDSPLITRFPGSVLNGCSDSPDDKFNYQIAGKDNWVEGEYHQSHYDFSQVASKAEVIRNIQTALKAGGFIVSRNGDGGYFLAQAGKSWVAIDVAGGSYAQTIVVEKKLEQLVSANAAALYSGLKTNGHMPIYGVYFDTGKADITPASADALKEVAKLVQKDPTLRLYVVGHTDNVGSVNSNMDLSQRRAAAVQKALTTDYGVPVAVLVGSFGAGPYAPVASNADEDGKAHNRRVELVAQ